jgi:hypothetical protein
MRIWFACFIGEFFPPFWVNRVYLEHAGHLVDHVGRREKHFVLRLLQVEVVLACLEYLVGLDASVPVPSAPPDKAR